jgi:hypothetical protein
MSATLGDDFYLKMTIAERIEFIETFDEMKAALELPPSYARTLAVQNADKRVSRVQRMVDEARLRLMPPVDEEAP